MWPTTRGWLGPSDRRVLELAFRHAADWPPSADGRARSVHVNLAEQQLAGSGTELYETVVEVLESTGLPAEQVVFEITETALLDRGSAVQAVLDPLVGLGLRFYLDDFGTGYSSLSNLDRFPIAGLKVDRSFADGLGVGGERTAIVTGILRMAEALGIDAIVEGVERVEQLRTLLRLDCTSAQGYLFERPMEPDELRVVLAGGPVLIPRAQD